MLMTEMIQWMFILFFGLAFINLPISFVLGIAATVSLMIANEFSVAMSVSFMLQGIDSFPLLACPFFILAGTLMEAGGISRQLVGIAQSVVGRLPGGLGMVAAVSSVFFGAISGSGPATLAAIGGIMIPNMVRAGYPLPWAAALCATAGCIGIFIPPSVAMINYAVTAGAPATDMLLGGIGPGLLTACALCVWSYIAAKRRGFGISGEPFSFRGVAIALKDGIWSLLMPFLILGGIYSGLFTPTEASALACVYAFLVGAFITRELTKHRFKEMLLKSAVTSAMILLIIATATSFGRLLTLGQLPGALVQFVIENDVSKPVFLLFVTIMLLIAGTFMEQLSTVLIVTPMLLPIALSLGIDIVHFGVLMVVNITFGMLTPPLGAHLFLACGMTNITLKDLLKEMVPFLVIALLVVLLTTYIPVISLFPMPTRLH